MTQGEERLLGGRYRLEGVLGRGGMGTVWRARDEVLGRTVAIKEVITPRGLDDDAREVMHKRMLREARAAARLSHPGIVTVHDVVEEDGVPWIVMEFVDARTLQDVIDNDGPLDEARVADIGRQILGALRAAHLAGILHRDVKPANVMLSEDRAILTDFGIAQMEGDASLTQTGIVMGSPAYISPERAQGLKPGPASDLWALGALMFAAVEGTAPFERPEVLSTLAAVMMEPVPELTHGHALAPVIMGLLAKEPAERLDGAAAAELLHRAEAPRRPRAEMTSFDQTAVVTDQELIPTAAVRAPIAPHSARTGMTFDNLYRQETPATPRTVPAPVQVPPPAPPAPDEQWIRDYDAGRPAPPKKQGTGLSIVIGAIVGVIAVLAVIFVVLDRDGKENGGKPVVTPSSGVGAGFTTEQVGDLTLAIPVGWKFDTGPKGSAMWKDQGSAAYVQLDTISWTGTAKQAAADWEKASSKGAFFSYDRVSLTEVPGLGLSAADLEFVYKSKRSELLLRAVVRRIRTETGVYALLVAYPATVWTAKRETVDNILASFKP